MFLPHLSECWCQDSPEDPVGPRLRPDTRRPCSNNNPKRGVSEMSHPLPTSQIHGVHFVLPHREGSQDGAKTYPQLACRASILSGTETPSVPIRHCHIWQVKALPPP